MRHARVSCLGVALGVLALAPPLRAQGNRGPGVVGEAPLPGGIRAALAALDDPVPADRGQFLFEVIRRFSTGHDDRIRSTRPVLVRLLAALDTRGGAAASRDTVPLPLSPSTWTRAVFGGSVQPADLIAAILRSADASRFYAGLLSLDPATREWLETQPDLIAEFSSQRSAAFLAAAPGLRVAGGVVRLPGGPEAVPVWQTLVGRPVSDAPGFTRALARSEDAHLAAAIGELALFAPPQVSFALALDNPAELRRIESARRLIPLVDPKSPLDPLLLLSALRTDGDGRPQLPGTEAFWRAVVTAKSAAGAHSLTTGEPVNFSSLCASLSRERSPRRDSLYAAAVFASRVIDRVTDANVADALEATRGVAEFPAMSAALERAGLADVGAFAAVARRARQLSSIANEAIAVRAITQFQGALVVIARGAARHSLSPDALPALVRDLAAVPLSNRGEYNGALARWIDANLPRDLVRFLAGAAVDARIVEWEGTRYRLDFWEPEAARLRRLLDQDEHPYFDTARTLAGVAKDGARADEDLARGLRHVAYALAIGQPDSLVGDLPDLEARHDLGLRGPGGTRAWSRPVAGDTPARGWGVRGSLFGLDATLASLSLVRLTSLPPARRPTVRDPDRQVLIEAVALLDPLSLTDVDGAALVAALARGAAAVAAVRTDTDADALADAAHLSPARRTLLAWTLTHDPARRLPFFSPMELVWLGLAGQPQPHGFDAWGAPTGPRLGGLRVALPPPQPLELFAGRPNTGLLASAFSDLNLRIAVVLGDLELPAALAVPVLAAATPDLVNGAVIRDEADRRGLVEYALALDRDRVEQYLATLTAGGPLIPVTGTGNGAPAPRALGVRR